MKSKRFLLLSVLVVFALPALLRGQDMDTAISNLATNVAQAIKGEQKKKVAVIDFTDLDGGSSELGKYVAEQLTVNLVMVRHDFSVLDRANMRKILAEHKLTATGLVNPENAKKLGQFAGVDAIILGTITPKKESVSTTAKIIATDTAEIVGAAKVEFKVDDTVQKLLSKSTKSETPADPDHPAPPPPPKLFGDLEVKMDSLRYVNNDFYGIATLSLLLTNTSETITYGVAFPDDPQHNINLSNSRGDEFTITDLQGIKTAHESNGSYYGSITDIPPKTGIIVTSKSQSLLAGKTAGDLRPYRLQTMLIFGEENQGHHQLKTYNLVLDMK